MKVSLFKERDFSLLMFGKLVSLIGSEMQSFALSLYILQITGSATQFAGILSVTMIPKIILGPFIGVLVDWFDRKKMIVYLDMFNGVLIGIYALMYSINGGLSVGSIYALAIILSLVSLVFQPAIATVVPTIVKKEDLVSANSLNMLILNLGCLIAPAIAGILFGSLGLKVILIINAVSFVLSSISEMFIRIPKANIKPEKINLTSFKNDFLEGINFIRVKKIIWATIIGSCIANFAFAPIGSIGLVYVCKKVLTVSDSQYGIMQSIVAIAMLTGPLVIGAVRKKFTVGKIIFLEFIFVGILTAIVAIIPTKFYCNLFSTNFPPFVTLTVMIFAIGILLSIGSIAMNTMFHKEVPINLMGRVNTVYSSGSMVAAPLGQMLFGVLFDNIPTWICFVITALIFISTALMLKKMLLSNEQGRNSAGKLEVSIDSNSGN